MESLKKYIKEGLFDADSAFDNAATELEWESYFDDAFGKDQILEKYSAEFDGDDIIISQNNKSYQALPICHLQKETPFNNIIFKGNGSTVFLEYDFKKKEISNPKNLCKKIISDSTLDFGTLKNIQNIAIDAPIIKGYFSPNKNAAGYYPYAGCTFKTELFYNEMYVRYNDPPALYSVDCKYLYIGEGLNIHAQTLSSWLGKCSLVLTKGKNKGSATDFMPMLQHKILGPPGTCREVIWQQYSPEGAFEELLHKMFQYHSSCNVEQIIVNVKKYLVVFTRKECYLWKMLLGEYYRKSTGKTLKTS